MEDKNAESGFPVAGAVDEKLACLAKCIRPASIVSEARITALSIKVEVGKRGQPVMAGISVRVA